MKVADVVISLNGRDEGKRFIVIDTQDCYSMLADGKGRRLEKPKRKKSRHVKLEGTADDWIAEKLRNGEKVTNNEIRRALAQFAAGHGEYSPGGNSPNVKADSSNVRTNSPGGEKPLLEKEGGGM